MVTEPSSRSKKSDRSIWHERRGNALFVLALIMLSTLVLTYLTSSRIEQLGGPAVFGLQAIALGCYFVIIFSVVRKGVVSVVTCILGCVLVNGAIVPASFGSTNPTPLASNTIAPSEAGSSHGFTQRILDMGRNMNFLLGFFMLIFGLLVGYRPSLLFARNRPQEAESLWDKYEIWNDNVVLATGGTEGAVHVKSLMNDLDRYLLWRYEYVLVNIYGTPYLVATEGWVPRNSAVVRDRRSGRVIGKPKFGGYFV